MNTPADFQRAVTPIRGTGTRRPLFLVHEGPEIDPQRCRALAQSIDHDVPLYGLAALPAQGHRPATVEAMAARLAHFIRAVQPHGPYQVAGWSFGGAIAYEVAAQLAGQGENVGLVALIDARHGLDPASDSPPGREAALGIPREAPSPLEQAYSTYVPEPIPADVRVFACGDGAGPRGVPGTLAWVDALSTPRWAAMGAPGIRWSIMQAPHEAALGTGISDALRQARQLPNGSQGKHFPVVPIKSGERGQPPFFCVPGAGASVLGFIPLAGALPADTPVLGLQPPGFEAHVPHSTIEAAAQSFLRGICEVHRHGPLHLIGHSLGAWQAFELGLLLQDQGREVLTLTLLDGAAPQGGFVRDLGPGDVVSKYIEVLELSHNRSIGIPPGHDDACRYEQTVRGLHDRMVQSGLLPRQSRPDAVRKSLRTFAAALRTRYQPTRAYQGKVSLVLASQTAARAKLSPHQESVAERWMKWAPLLEVCSMPGNHFSMLRQPHVQLLAERWRRDAPSPAAASD